MNFRRLGQLRSLNSKQLDSTVVGRYGQVVRALAECEGLDASSNSAVGKNGSAQKESGIAFLKGHRSIITAVIK